MATVIQSGYIGSSSLLTSTANQEIVPSGYKFNRFYFMNQVDCTVQINGSQPIFLKADQGFESNAGTEGFETDFPITSFIVVAAGVSFNWFGSYKNVEVTQ